MRYRLFISWFLIILSGLIIFASIGVYSVVNLIPQYEKKIELIISKKLGAKVDFKIDKIMWKGFEPVINVRDVSINNIEKNYSLSLSHVVVKLNLIDSLVTWKPSADAIEIDNLNINFKLKKGSKEDAKQKSFLSQPEIIASIIDTLEVLTNQNRVVFKNAVITIETKKENIILPFMIQWNKIGYGQYRLLLKATMKNENNIKLSLNVQSSIFFGISAVGKLDLNLSDFGAYIPSIINSCYEFRQGDADIRMRFNIEHDLLKEVASHVKITNLYLDSQNQLEQPINLSKLETNINYQFDSDAWGLEFSNSFVGIAGEHIGINRLNIYGNMYSKESNRIKINLSNLDLGAVNGTYHVLTKFFNNKVPQLAYLQNIDVFGGLEKTNILINYTGSDLLGWEVESHVKDIGFNNYKSKLSVKNLSGHFYTSKNAGWVLIDSPNLKFKSDDILENPVPEVKVKTFVEWNKRDGVWQIKFNDLGFADPDLTVKVFGVVKVPEKNPEKTLVKIYGFINGVDIGQKFKHFLPKIGIEPDLYAWLTKSVMAVKQANGFFLIDGPIMQMPFQHNEGQFTVGADVLGASFHPYTKWPLINDTNARLWFHNQRVEILGVQGNSRGANVKSASFVIPNIAPGVPSFMQINGEVEAKSNESNSYITNSPLMDTVGVLMNNVDYQGDVNVNLSLRFPLGDPSAENEVKGIVNVHGGTAKIKLLDVDIYNLEGAVTFDDHAYTINNLTGWFDPFAQLSVNLLSQKINKDSYIYTGSIEASLPIDVLTKNLPSRIRGNLSGYVPINMHFKMSDSDGGKIKFKSSLVDVQSNFPAPMKFDKGLLNPLYGEVGWNPAFNIFHGKINFNVQSDISVNINNNKIPLTASLLIPKLDIVQWVNFFDSEDGSLQPLIFQNGSLNNWQQYQFNDAPELFSQSWYCPNMMPNVNCLVKNIIGDYEPNLHLQVGALDVYGHQFNDFVVDANTSSKKINISVAHSGKGNVEAIIPLDGYKPWDIELNNIKILHKNENKIETRGETTKDKNMAISGIDANTLALVPPMQVLIKKLTVFDRKIDDSVFSLNPLYNGISIPSFMVKDKGDSLLLGDARFYGNPLQASFSLKGTSNNWGQLLGFYGYKDILEGGNGPITANLNWKNTYIPDMSNISGKVMFNIKDGVIQKVKPGLSKLIGIFSINTYLARLTTSYSDFTTTGMMFNQIIGKYSVNDGVARTDPQFQISTPSLDAIVKGYINFKDNTINQTATLQPHLSGIIAIAAGVLGGPILGVATYLVEELVSNTILKNSGLITLHLSGNLSDPKVTKEAL